MWTASLVATPAVASRPARGPPRMPQPRTNSMSGPGVTIATVVVNRNTVSTWLSIGTWPSYDRPRSSAAPQFALEHAHQVHVVPAAVAPEALAVPAVLGEADLVVDVACGGVLGHHPEEDRVQPHRVEPVPAPSSGSLHRHSDSHSAGSIGRSRTRCPETITVSSSRPATARRSAAHAYQAAGPRRKPFAGTVARMIGRMWRGW